MKAILQDAQNRAYQQHEGNKYTRVVYNESFESSLHDRYAARYFERLDKNGKEIDAPVAEVLR